MPDLTRKELTNFTVERAALINGSSEVICEPICTLTLANNPAGSDVLALKVKPGCDALVTRFGPTGWRMEQGGLALLSSRGQSWQFEAADANTWQRVPESSVPMLLVRQ